MKRLAICLLLLAATSPLPAQAVKTDATPFAIDAQFPGGNVVVDKIDGHTVSLSPDLAGTTEPWFYWYFRVHGAGGRTLSFVFNKDYVGVRGPGVSLDAGKTWTWLGSAAVKDGIFSYTFPAGADEVRFSVGMPYVRADFERFVAKHKENPYLEVGMLTKTPKGRDVVLVRVGDKNRTVPNAIAITGRHHCCEMMASYVLEGILAGALADDEAGRWLRAHADFLFVPFMDTDGVEDGNQGKNRAPHDHNRDYAGAPLYREVAALKERLQAWAAGRPLVFLDLHNPALKTDIHETVHFLEPDDRHQAQRLDELTTLLERNQQGPIIYSRHTTMRFGTGYNRPTAGTSAGWAQSLPNTILGCTLETAYANAGGSEVNAHSARELGRDLTMALKDLLNANLGSPSGPPHVLDQSLVGLDGWENRFPPKDDKPSYAARVVPLRWNEYRPGLMLRGVELKRSSFKPPAGEKLKITFQLAVNFAEGRQGKSLRVIFYPAVFGEVFFDQGADGGWGYQGDGFGRPGQGTIVLRRSDVKINSFYRFTLLVDFKQQTYDITVEGQKQDGGPFAYRAAGVAFQPSQVRAEKFDSLLLLGTGYLGSFAVESPGPPPAILP